ncbi:MAG TPA: hypothetical protein VH227_06720 [Candidatus Udaeobacter sp.]|nr:hypothetical protein [Candidatus Udaeobacter sp.]
MVQGTHIHAPSLTIEQSGNLLLAGPADRVLSTKDLLRDHGHELL